ncbi:peptidoglycan-associated lipoprotein Pal [Carnimonas nigrificans]|uniref:peptidoglycan-associated lipoprotein Pal n=1 Tax=Carnimonas nigrificans TaxID=64323 RepID=UPI0004709BBE|nr:peptidoglycan-associated lipoprotein Pal [Carnimonas nigrificans]
MQFSTYAKTLAAALSVVVIAGCSSGGGTQEGTDGGMSSGQQGTATTGGATGYGNGSGAGNAGAQNEIPSVRTIYFDFDHDTIRPEFESVLNQHAAYLQSHPDAHVVLQGHTDPQGTREYNLGLGERRANSVRQYLAVQGVNGSQVEVVSYGEERPASTGNSQEAYAQDRRVVFDY